MKKFNFVRLALLTITIYGGGSIFANEMATAKLSLSGEIRSGVTSEKPGEKASDTQVDVRIDTERHEGIKGIVEVRADYDEEQTSLEKAVIDFSLSGFKGGLGLGLMGPSRLADYSRSFSNARDSLQNPLIYRQLETAGFISSARFFKVSTAAYPQHSLAAAEDSEEGKLVIYQLSQGEGSMGHQFNSWLIYRNTILTDASMGAFSYSWQSNSYKFSSDFALGENPDVNDEALFYGAHLESRHTLHQLEATDFSLYYSSSFWVPDHEEETKNTLGVSAGTRLSYNLFTLGYQYVAELPSYRIAAYLPTLTQHSLEASYAF